MFAKRLILRSLLFLLAASALRAQEGFPIFTTDYPPEEFAARRSAVYDAIGKRAFAVIQGAPTPVGYVRFRQSNDFYYLCGVEVPNAYLLLDGTTRRATLFLPHRNARRENGEGKMWSSEDAEEIQKLAGVEAVAGVDLLAENIGRFAQRPGAVLFVLSRRARVSRSAATSPCAASRSSARIRSTGALRARPLRRADARRFPQMELRDLTPTLDGLRLIKSAREIAMLLRSTRLSGLALIEGMKSTRPGQYERELDGMAKFIYYRNGAQGEAYYSLIASGRNAWYPHYNAGKRKMEDGDFLLMDFAPDVGYAQSDVTRMWPVNGRFSGWQRELYGFYLGCYEAILKAIRPGATPAECMQDAAKKMDGILGSAKFSKEIYKKAAQEFVESYRKQADRPDAALGHWVGMATHDDGPHEGPLKAGMVFTIEPALRVPEEKIYVRLEDMIVVTDKGTDVLSDFVPRDIPRIEKLMTEKGLLKTYPRED